MAFTVYANILDGYVDANIWDNFTLYKSGIVRVDESNSQLQTQGGHTYVRRGYAMDTGAWQTPVAGASMTAGSLATYYQTGVIARRGNAYTIGDFDATAGGADTSVLQGVSEEMAANFVYNVENTLFTYHLPALFNLTNGSLSGSHLVNKSTSAFSINYLLKAQAMNGRPQLLNKCIIHPDVYVAENLSTLLEPTPELNSTTPNRLSNVGDTSYAGRIYGIDFYLSNKCYNSTNVYDTYLFGDGGLYLDFQKTYNIEMQRNILLEAGATIAKYAVAFGTGVEGVTFSGTTPTLIVGGTDTVYNTASNWTKRTGVDNSQIKIACVKSLI